MLKQIECAKKTGFNLQDLNPKAMTTTSGMNREEFNKCMEGKEEEAPKPEEGKKFDIKKVPSFVWAGAAGAVAGGLIMKANDKNLWLGALIGGVVVGGIVAAATYKPKERKMGASGRMTSVGRTKTQQCDDALLALRKSLLTTPLPSSPVPYSRYQDAVIKIVDVARNCGIHAGKGNVRECDNALKTLRTSIMTTPLPSSPVSYSRYQDDVMKLLGALINCGIRSGKGHYGCTTTLDTLRNSLKITPSPQSPVPYSKFQHDFMQIIDVMRNCVL
jgi:hypothetical protein